MARQRIPQVVDGHLQPVDGTDGFRSPILVGSPAWYGWLKEEAAQSFAFRSAQGTLTVRREQSHGNRYWYAYRTRQGKLHKAYLGKLEASLAGCQYAAPSTGAERKHRASRTYFA